MSENGDILKKINEIYQILFDEDKKFRPKPASFLGFKTYKVIYEIDKHEQLVLQQLIINLVGTSYKRRKG